MAKGNAAIMEAVCKAFKPPCHNNTAAALD